MTGDLASVLSIHHHENVPTKQKPALVNLFCFLSLYMLEILRITHSYGRHVLYVPE